MTTTPLVTPVPGPQLLPSSIRKILARVPNPLPPTQATTGATGATGAQLFQRVQQLQAQQAFTANPAYQSPPPPPLSSNSLFASAAPSNIFAPSTTFGLFGGFGNPSTSNPYTFQSNPFVHAPVTQDRFPTSKEERDYFSASPNVDSSKTLGSFEPFLRLPIEIIGLVVEQCALQDGVCLSLTSKDMYGLVRAILLRKDKKAYSLNRMSNYECIHFLSKSGVHKPCTLRSCCKAGRYHGRHCRACTACPLWVRLSNDNWSGLPSKQFAYCSSDAIRWERTADGEVPPGAHTILSGNSILVRIAICGKFKLKKKFHKGKCLHGGPRPKKRKVGQGSLTWTQGKGGGGWQRRGQMWKTLYTEKDLRTFQNRYKEERESSERTGGYSLRRRPKPTSKRVEHVNLSYGVDLENPSGRGPVEGTEGWEEEVQQRRGYKHWGGTLF